MEQSQYQHPNPNPSLFQLFISFLRLGATAFGGPAMVAYIRKMAVEKNRWLDDQSAHDGVALCQTIPGATAMQMSAYVGLRAKGVAGAAASFIGFGLPAFLFMMILSALYARTHTLPAVVSAFNGLQAIVVALVANATLSFGRTSIKNWKNVINALIAAGLFGLKINPILVIIVAAFLGVVLYAKQPHPSVVNPKDKAHAPKSLLLILLVTAIGFTALLFFRPKAVRPCHPHVQDRSVCLWRRVCLCSSHVLRSCSSTFLGGWSNPFKWHCSWAGDPGAYCHYSDLYRVFVERPSRRADCHHLCIFAFFHDGCWNRPLL